MARFHSLETICLNCVFDKTHSSCPHVCVLLATFDCLGDISNNVNVLIILIHIESTFSQWFVTAVYVNIVLDTVYTVCY